MSIAVPPLNFNSASSAKSGDGLIGAFNFSPQKGFTTQQMLIAGGVLVAGLLALRYLKKAAK